MASLYIHIPFCEKKCFYCSFVVAVGKKQHIDSYLYCLDKEAASHKGRGAETIYVGGGTPTFLANDQLRELKRIIESHFKYADKSEFTIEANPEGLDPDRARFLFDLGINRVSLGIQSFDNKYLKFLGRAHDTEAAVTAFENLRGAGFDNINVDLMYSFPRQNPEEIRDDVKRLCNLGSEHVSLYTFTVEPHSRFFAQGVKQEAGDKQAGQYELVVQLLTQSGFRQYEISNFARPGKESLHNLNYWQGGDYIGLGVGAHSHLGGRRCWNVSRFNEYISRIKQGYSAMEGAEELTPQARLREALLLGLRMNKGVDIREYEQRFESHLPEEANQKIKEFVESGLLEWEDSSLRATPKGRLLLDELSAYLI